MKKYIKPECTEQMLAANTFLLADKSGAGGDKPGPFGGAPARNTRPF